MENRLQELINEHSDDGQAESPHTMVWQVWQDGEVTLQKCGELLWQRNLHMIYPGFPGFDRLGVTWPHRSGDNSYIFTTEAGAKAIHREIARLADKHAYCS